MRFKPLNCLPFLMVCWGKASSWSFTKTASDAASALFPQNCMRFKLYCILWTFQIAGFAGFALAGKICKTGSSKLTILWRHLGLWVGSRLGTSWCGTLSWSNSSFQWDHVQHWNFECDLVYCYIVKLLVWKLLLVRVVINDVHGLFVQCVIFSTNPHSCNVFICMFVKVLEMWSCLGVGMTTLMLGMCVNIVKEDEVSVKICNVIGWWPNFN